MDNEKYLKLPIEIDSEMKDLIKRSYCNAINEMEEHEFVYIDKKITSKIRNTKDIKPKWVANLSSFYNCFYEILIQARNNKIKITPKTYKGIGAALFYFINPYDIIPDFTPEIGYADDYYVLLLCIDLIAEEDRKMITERLSSIETSA
jgi:uncharacterized membrane protein YkvA (DUF1232 family)